MDQKYLFNQKTDRLVLISIFIIGFILRLSLLPYADLGLIVDEAELVTEAISFLTTGVDKNGNAWPLFFHAFGHEEGVVLPYFLVLPFTVFGTNDLTAKAIMLIINFLILPLTYAVVKKWLGKGPALAATFFVAVSPWLLNLSRLVYNVSLVAVMYMAAYLCFTKGWQERKKRWLITAFLLFGLSFYTYPLSWLWVGLWLTVWSLAHIKNLKNGFQERRLGLVIGFSLFLVIILPVILWIAGGGQKSLSLGPFHLPKIVELRFDEVGGQQWNNIGRRFQDYIGHWSPFFWFSDSRNFDFTPYFGLMYFMELPFFLLGFARMSRHPKQYLFFLLWLIVGWIPSALSGNNVPHPLRSVSVIPVLSIISGLGLVRFIEFIKIKEEEKINQWLRVSISTFFGILFAVNILAFIILNSSSYHKKYWLFLPKTGFGLQEVAMTIEKEWENYDQIILIHSQLEEPWIQLLRYSPFLLKKYQTLTTSTGLTERNSFQRLEKLSLYREPPEQGPQNNTLYFVEPGLYPNMSTLATVEYPFDLGTMVEVKTLPDGL